MSNSDRKEGFQQRPTYSHTYSSFWKCDLWQRQWAKQDNPQSFSLTLWGQTTGRTTVSCVYCYLTLSGTEITIPLQRPHQLKVNPKQIYLSQSPKCQKLSHSQSTKLKLILASSQSGKSKMCVSSHSGCFWHITHDLGESFVVKIYNWNSLPLLRDLHCLLLCMQTLTQQDCLCTAEICVKLLFSCTKWQKSPIIYQSAK